MNEETNNQNLDKDEVRDTNQELDQAIGQEPTKAESQDIDTPHEEISIDTSQFVRQDFREERALINSLKQECAKIIVGQEEVIEKMLVCIIADGHILLEGVPGIAKTLSARTLARSIESEFNRIQFTPDLLPADILGTSIFNMKESEFSFKKGPIFSNVVLIDEINRAPAKTQAALFEAMEEKQVSFDGITYDLKFPFLVIATQNPVEQEGTYRLPEAQLDRFMMKIVLKYPSFNEELDILNRFKNQVGKLNLSIVKPVLNADNIKQLQEKAATVIVEDHMLNYITKIVQETRNNASIYLGASPRASLAILRTSKVMAMISGRDYVIPDDIQYVVPDIINHRIILSPDAEMSGDTSFDVIADIIKQIEVPR